MDVPRDGLGGARAVLGVWLKPWAGVAAGEGSGCSQLLAVELLPPILKATSVSLER